MHCHTWVTQCQGWIQVRAQQALGQLRFIPRSFRLFFLNRRNNKIDFDGKKCQGCGQPGYGVYRATIAGIIIIPKKVGGQGRKRDL